MSLTVMAACRTAANSLRRARVAGPLGVVLLIGAACSGAPRLGPTPTPALDHFETCAVAMSGSEAMIEVKGLDAHIGCAFLESFRDQAERWHLIPAAFGPIVCSRTAGARTYTIHDLDPSGAGDT